MLLLLGEAAAAKEKLTIMFSLHNSVEINRKRKIAVVFVFFVVSELKVAEESQRIAFLSV